MLKKEYYFYLKNNKFQLKITRGLVEKKKKNPGLEPPRPYAKNAKRSVSQPVARTMDIHCRGKKKKIKIQVVFQRFFFHITRDKYISVKIPAGIPVRKQHVK